MPAKTAYQAKIPDQHGRIAYSADEDLVWRDLCAQQLPNVRKYAAKAYLDGLKLAQSRSGPGPAPPPSRCAPAIPPRHRRIVAPRWSAIARRSGHPDRPLRRTFAHSATVARKDRARPDLLRHYRRSAHTDRGSWPDRPLWLASASPCEVSRSEHGGFSRNRLPFAGRISHK